jgi:hypothetical protein
MLTVMVTRKRAKGTLPDASTSTQIPWDSLEDTLDTPENDPLNHSWTRIRE